MDCIGQIRHFGLRAVQSVAAASVRQDLFTAIKPCRAVKTATPVPANVTRSFYVAGTTGFPAQGWPNAKLMTAPAVYSPMPLNERSVGPSDGSSPP